MSSEEDTDIDRLRSDLINSIRTRKSSRVNSGSPLTSQPKADADASGSNADTNLAATIFDTDMDDLEALRRAALVTMRTSKTNPSNEAVSSAYFIQDPHRASSSIANSVSNVHSSGTIGTATYSQNSVHPPPPVLLGPTASFSQFPAPPPAYKPRFFNHHANNFRQMLRPMRSNLIVIQTAPPPEAAQRMSSPSYSKLFLPQDRYSRQDVEGKRNDDKRKRDDKWSRYDDTSGDSSGSSAGESDHENDNQSVVSDTSADGNEFRETLPNGGTTLAETSGMEETTRDTEFGPMDSSETAGGHSPGSMDSTHSESESEYQNGAGSVTKPTSSRDPRVRQSEEDFLLEEPVHTIEFLDEPVDEETMLHLANSSPGISETTSTPELTQDQSQHDQSKESKRQKLKSKLQAVQQQLQELYRHKKPGGTSERSGESGYDRGSSGERWRRHEERGSSSRSSSRTGEPLAKYSKREESGHKQRLLSSVVAVSKSRGGSADRDISRSHHRGGARAERKKDRFMQEVRIGKTVTDESDRRNTPSAERISAQLESGTGLPSANEDLRKFLEQKKGKRGSAISTRDDVVHWRV